MKLTTMTHVTVDGVVQGNGGATDEDRRNGFERGGWALGVGDSETVSGDCAGFLGVQARDGVSTTPNLGTLTESLTSGLDYARIHVRL